jgi:hypothetical protein
MESKDGLAATDCAANNAHTPEAIVRMTEIDRGVYALPDFCSANKSLYMSEDFKTFGRNVRRRGDLVASIRFLFGRNSS